jgi:Zn-finger nucleic acid-binding protein
MKCPRCPQVDLVTESYEGVEIDRCPNCQGTWLDEKELHQIVETHDEKFSREVITYTLNHACAGIPKQERDKHLKCPKCGDEMTALNYNYQSGVIIDRCPKHGVWLDKNELEQIQAYREHWEKEVDKHKDEWSLAVQKVAQDERHRVTIEHKEDDAFHTSFLHFFNNLFNKLSK